MVGCTDGTYEGKRIFYCTARTGYFCPISDVLELQSMYRYTQYTDQYTEDEHHHRHSPKVHPRHTAAGNQQIFYQIPDWLKTDNVVGVNIPGARDPITGMVKFVGILQVKGVDRLMAGIQLVSC